MCLITYFSVNGYEILPAIPRTIIRIAISFWYRRPSAVGPDAAFFDIPDRRACSLTGAGPGDAPLLSNALSDAGRLEFSDPYNTDNTTETSLEGLPARSNPFPANNSMALKHLRQNSLMTLHAFLGTIWPSQTNLKETRPDNRSYTYRQKHPALASVWAIAPA